MEKARIVSLDEAYNEVLEKAERKQQWVQQRKGKLVTAHRRKMLPVKPGKATSKGYRGEKASKIADELSENQGYKQVKETTSGMEDQWVTTHYKHPDGHTMEHTYHTDMNSDHDKLKLNAPKEHHDIARKVS